MGEGEGDGRGEYEGRGEDERRGLVLAAAAACCSSRVGSSSASPEGISAMQQPVSMPRIGTPACMSATHVPLSAALSRPPSSCVICTTILTAVRGCSAVIRHGSSVEMRSCSSSRSTGPGSPARGLTITSIVAASVRSLERLTSVGA